MNRSSSSKWADAGGFSPRISAIVLAAGASIRFGSPKLLVSPDGVPGRRMIESVVNTALKANFHQILVVVGCYADEISAVLKEYPVELVMNDHWQEGLSSSVRAGLERLSPEVDAAMFMLADQPAIAVQTLRTLMEQYRRTHAPIVAPVYHGRRGNPVLFDRRTFDALRQISGDQGGRQVMASGQFDMTAIEVDDPAILMDIDKPGDLKPLNAHLQKKGAQQRNMQDIHSGSLVSNGTGTSVLRNIRGWLIDLDGVIYRGDQVLEGAADFVAQLRAENVPFLFLTNNSTRTPEQYAGRLQSMGIAAEPDEFYTSAFATAEYLSRQSPPGARILMIGLDGLKQALTDAGFELVRDYKEAQYCVVGYSNRLTYDDLRRATLAIRAGATFVATNPDPTLPVEEGLIPGIGATLAALTAASDVKPIVIGKPERIIVDLALRRLGIPANHCGMLGDRLDTDILGGKKAGLWTVMVLTGSNDEADIAASDIHPDMVVRNLLELTAHWKARLEE